MLNDATNFWKLLTTTSTVILLVVVVAMHMYDLSVEKERGYVSPESTIFSRGRHSNVFTNLIICAVHAPVGVHFIINEKVSSSFVHISAEN